MRIRRFRISALAAILAFPLIVGRPSSATAGPASAAQPNLYAAKAFGTSAYTVAVGDFNGDGIPDVAEPAFDDSMDVFLGNGDGTFGAATTYPIGLVADRMVAADLNADGLSDMVAISIDGGQVSVVLNNGDGTFSSAQLYSVGDPFLSDITTGDVTGDGHPDLVATKGAGLVILPNNGDGTFGTPVTYPSSIGPGSVTVGDLNGDGVDDVAATVFKKPASSGVAVWLSRADGTLHGPHLYSAGPFPGSVVIARLDGDTHPDVALLDGVGDVDVLINQGGGNLGTPVPYPVGASSPISLVATDLNHDGANDLVVAGQSGTVSILAGNGDGTFGSGVSFGGGASPWEIVVADLNGDRRQDVVVGDGNTGFAALLGNGDGTFESAATIALPNSPRVVVQGDFNGDGITDLAVMNNLDEFADGDVAILLGDGRDGFALAGDYDAGLNPLAMTTADFNGDGHPDLAFANGQSIENNVSILLNNGDGTFGSTITLSDPDFPEYIVSGDFNGDGHADLALGISVFGEETDLHIYPGNGDGTFGTMASYQGRRGTATGLSLGDLNGDGRPDLVLAINRSLRPPKSTLAIFLGSADGSFQTALENFSFLSGDLTIANLNGDQKPDLAVTDQAGSVAYFQGKGNGSFEAPIEYGAGFVPISVVAGDLNGDGTLDLVVGHVFGTVSVLVGEPGGTFDSPVTYANGSSASVSIGDMITLGRFDSSKRLDAAVTEFNTQDVAILKQLPSDLPP